MVDEVPVQDLRSARPLSTRVNVFLRGQNIVMQYEEVVVREFVCDAESAKALVAGFQKGIELAGAMKPIVIADRIPS